MSNFQIFDREKIRALLDPFAPGMSEHITPICYEAITPDCFLLLFTTVGQDGKNNYFVSLESDSVGSLDGARCTIEDWGNEVIDFLPLSNLDHQPDEFDIENYRYTLDRHYSLLLAKVEKPKSRGYWSNATLIMPGDKIGDKIANYSDVEQKAIREMLERVLKNSADPSKSFLDSYVAVSKDAIVNDVNKTSIAVSVFINRNGEVECFYNYIRQGSS